MDSKREFLDLPNEVIDLVLQNRGISFTDICSISQTCTKMQYLCLSNELWRRKLQQRWPKLLLRYSREKAHDWLKEFKTYAVVGRAVRGLVSQLSPRFYKLEEIPDDGFSDVVSLMEEHNAAEVIINELNEIIHDDDRYKNLTNKYYAVKLLRHIFHLHLTEKWKAHLQQPPDEQKLEIGATIISQWFQPTDDVTENSIIDRLDDIAERVKQNLPENLASLYSEGVPTLSTKQERVVLETMNHVIYTEMGFHGNEENYYDENNSFINKVLDRKFGIPISLSVLYLSIARRLAVICECVNFPSHFLLKWKEHPMATVDKQYTFIDAFHGKFITEIGGDHTVFTDSIPHIEVYKRMLRNLINIARNHHHMRSTTTFLRDAVEMMLLTTPDDTDYQLLLVKIFMYLKINQEKVKDLLLDIELQDESRVSQVARLTAQVERSARENEELLQKKTKPKYRAENKEVRFSVGMVMKHKRYNYMCVIFGWDLTCQASREWIIQMGVHMLPRKDKQPFYNVLVEDGSIRYAADENLYHPESYCEIPHPDVGKYFQEFTGRYYVINNEKAEEYPDDVQETRTTVEGRGQ
ncbi:F-box only protein 21-like [Saccostrea echinata]|uniref:F-box only protein 21-like n=1 Tax=Saccostrea echinata TaxID=191078 RepID=UPI002A83DCCD|nr:F-box only protein 21-like [Saccostrea echinata]